MSSLSLICCPAGFKIRKKSDVRRFITNCMINENEYIVRISSDFAVIIEKDSKGNISVGEKIGDLQNIFNPILLIANTKNGSSEEFITDYLWKYRKYINAKWFND